MGGLDGQSGKFVGFRGNPGQYEVTEIDWKAAAGISDLDVVHFYLADGDETETQHYVWFDKSTGQADPVAGGIQHEVAIDGLVTETEIAAAVAAVIDAIGGIGCTAAVGVTTLTNDYKGVVTEAVVSAGTPTDSITVTQDGSDFDAANCGRGSENRIKCPYCNGTWFMVKDSYMVDDGDVPSDYDGYNAAGTVGLIIFLCWCGREFGKPKTDWAEMLGSN